jgi:hypothetical protein
MKKFIIIKKQYSTKHQKRNISFFPHFARTICLNQSHSPKAIIQAKAKNIQEFSIL